MKIKCKKLILFISSVGFIVLVLGCSSPGSRTQWQALHNEEQEKITLADSLSVKDVSLNDSLDDLVKKALLNNRDLESNFVLWKAAMLSISSAKRLPDPFLTYSNYIESVETRVGPQKQAIQFMQKLPFFGKLDTVEEKALAKAKAAKARYENKKLKIVYDLKEIYYEYAYLTQAIKITDENMQLLRYFEQVAQTKYKAGNAQNQDLLKVQVELGKISDKLISLTDFEPVLKSKLSTVLGLPINTEAVFLSTMVFPAYTENSFKKNVLTEDLIKNNPELEELSYQIQEAKEDIHLAKLMFFPDLSVGATYIDTAKGPLDVAQNGKDPLIVMFSVNLPIWYGSLDSSLGAAEEVLAAKETMLKDMILKLQTKLELVLYKVKDALRKINLYQDALIPKAKQSMEITQASYKAGSTDFLNLIDTQRNLLEFELNYERAKADFYQRLAELEQLIGTNIDYNKIS